MEIFLAIVVFVLIGFAASEILRRRKFDKMQIVSRDVEYPNNHHVIGVGYYHANAQQWFPHPWNEYREGRGYYWAGAWHATPDQQVTLKSVPPAAEIDRVNQEWRNADPDRAKRFWDTVEHQGFGTAIRRSERS